MLQPVAPQQFKYVFPQPYVKDHSILHASLALSALSSISCSYPQMSRQGTGAEDDDCDLSLAERDRALRCTRAADTAYRVMLEELSGDVFLAAYRASFEKALAEQIVNNAGTSTT